MIRQYIIRIDDSLKYAKEEIDDFERIWDAEEYDDVKYHEEHGEIIVEKDVWEDAKKALMAIEAIKAEIEEEKNNYKCIGDNWSDDTAYGLELALDIIDKHISKPKN